MLEFQLRDRLRWLKKMNPSTTFKLLLIGDSGTGKSSLLLRFIEDRFLGENCQPPTIGVDFKVRIVSIDGQTIKLTIWDTAGQERFRALTSSYYRGAHGIILVYDVTNQETFDHLRDWISELDNHSNIHESIKMVVGNKNDKQESRAISRERGIEYSKSIGALFTETSAKTSNNVNEVFQELVRKIIESPHLLQANTTRSQNFITEDGSDDMTGCNC